MNNSPLKSLDAGDLQCHVPPLETAMRIDLFLARNFPNRSRRTIQSAISAGSVFIGDRRAESDFSVRGGEVLRIAWQGQKCGGNFKETKQREGDLRILYEDDHVIGVYKRAGEVVHPAENFYGPSTVSAVLRHCGGKLSTCGEGHRPGVVHRLDRDTTGVLLFAKTNSAHESLAGQFFSRAVRKGYEALACGTLRKLSGIVRGAIGRDKRRRTRMAIVQGGRDAETAWSAKSIPGKAFSHFMINPRSGRMHQIRVHMASIGHPVLGDWTYGCPPLPFHVERTMLHAKYIVFSHPQSGLSIRVEAPLADDMADLLNNGGGGDKMNNSTVEIVGRR
ncbi:MAG: RluA family pseudouridine synthase [Puniceicoccales bacterium]|jgi:23S rRNA pseudouridine1911/1915/1917 synthase|nr:RluA family pseudouridine synthase [Puniceicoccales bacterium]